jgi:hypothetical protein
MVTGRAVLTAMIVGVAGGTLLAAAPDSGAGSRESYRFVLTAVGRGEVAFRGLINVDGKDRLLEREMTPFEFRCEAGSIISGYFEVIDHGRLLRLKVYDPGYSKRRPAVIAKKVERVRFSWAQPGAGPRCVDLGGGACPESTPSMDELQCRLDAGMMAVRTGRVIR